jgi:hypothetical protein
MTRTRGVRELVRRGSRWTLVATLGVACAGRSIERDDGQSNTEPKAGAANVDNGGGHGGSIGASSNGVGGAYFGVGGDGGGTTPFPTAGTSAGENANDGARSGAPNRGNGGNSGKSGTRNGGAGGNSGKSGTRNGGTGGNFGVSGDAGAGSIAGDAGAGNPYPCLDSRPWSSNALVCENGFIHRTRAGACALPSRDGEGGQAGDGPGFGGAKGASTSVCATDADCGASSYCIREVLETGLPSTQCAQACQTDADCGAYGVCLCSTQVKATGASVEFGQCVDAGCRVDADCAAGFSCAANPLQLAWGFSCQTPYDECGSTIDCDGLACLYNDGLYRCT